MLLLLCHLSPHPTQVLTMMRRVYTNLLRLKLLRQRVAVLRFQFLFDAVSFYRGRMATRFAVASPCAAWT